MSGVDQVWCLGSGSELENQINRTVDGAVLSIVLTGLLPDVRYTVAVAAVTSLGVGAQSPPVSLLLSESLKLLQLLQIEKYAEMRSQRAQFATGEICMWNVDCAVNDLTTEASSTVTSNVFECKNPRKGLVRDPH